MGRPALELADIFRRHGPAYRQAHRLPRHQLRLMRAIETCRTAALGGHVERCGQCQYTRISYNCRNRHCPKCQSLARAPWLERRKAELLPVEYFHAVFTVPERIAAIAFHNKAVVYGILFRAAAETLLTIARDSKHLGAEIGFFAILHTWGQNLLHHPHLHCVVPGGGLAPDGARWIACKPGFFLPARVLSRLFRRLLLEALQRAFDQGLLDFFGELQPLQSPAAFSRHLATLRQTDWVVYAKPPFGGPQQALEYLGRYTHRVAISNQRLQSMDGGQVSFRWKDYRHHDKLKTMTLAAAEFIRRFLPHALPPGFQRIRHYGLLSNCRRNSSLALCRKLLATAATQLLPQPRDYKDLHAVLTAQPLTRCPHRGADTMLRIQILSAYRWPAQPPDSS
jgi:hypothetical protein